MLLRRKPRVLLLDDDPSMQRLVSALLKREGYRVDVFLTGREAIAAMEKEPYAVVLLDLMMPHEGGLTVIRHLESKKPEDLKRVVVLTASSETVVGKIRDLVADVVLKPFSEDALTRAVKKVADAK